MKDVSGFDLSNYEDVRKRGGHYRQPGCGRLDQPYENHNGGQSTFGPNEYLYIGDEGQNDYEEIDFQPMASNAAENYSWADMGSSARDRLVVHAGIDHDGPGNLLLWRG